MKVLITGATGLVGRALVPLLLKNNCEVNYLTTSRLSDKRLPGNGYHWNPADGTIDERCIEGVDAIIHLAGASISKRWTAPYKKEILESRVASANLLYDLLDKNEHNVEHFISASAIGVYPDSLNAVYSEDFQESDQSFLGQVVKEWEAAADRIGSLGIRVAKVRTGLVFAGNGGALPEMAKPVRFGLGSGLGSGRQMQSWIHIDDLAHIYTYILFHELEGIYNAVAPYPVTNNELMKTIAGVLDKPFVMPNVPSFLLKLVLSEMHILLVSSQNVSARKIISEGYQFHYLSLEKALRNLLV